MHIVLLPEMRRSFVDTGSLELENFITERTLHELKEAIDKKLKPSQSFVERFVMGRDLFREDEAIKRVVCSKSHASFIKDLIKERELILGFDQLLDFSKGMSLKSPSTMEEIFSVSPLKVGMIICLKPSNQTEGIFPKSPGSVTFFNPEIAIDWEKEGSSGQFLLIGYGEIGSMYIENPQDLASDSLKKFDYRHHHPLKSQTHPYF